MSASAIHKYPLEPDRVSHVQHPYGVARHFGEDGAGQLCVWVQIYDTGDPAYDHRYYVVATGWEMPEAADVHVGSFVAPSRLVWHLYREAEPLCMECGRYAEDPAAPDWCIQHADLAPSRPLPPGDQ